MDSDKYVILIEGEDKTSSVIKWFYDNRKLIVFVTYTNGKRYPYRVSEFRVLENPKVIPCVNVVVLKDGSSLQNVSVLLDFGEYVRIVYKNGKRELCRRRSIKIINSALDDPRSKNCFDYLKQIADRIGLVVDNLNILAERYNKIDFIREDSVLASFLNGHYDPAETTGPTQALYPFGFNLSQKQAVINALKYDISVIEGPPGTGKTQTILNIIANAVMRGESVAVVSSNNSATANVLEKLQKYNVDFIVAPLGSSDNKEAFIANQKPDIDLEKLRSTGADFQNCVNYEAKLSEALSCKNEVSELSERLKNIKTEYEHFLDYYETLDVDTDLIAFKYGITAYRILEFASEYELLQKREYGIGFIGSIVRFIRSLILQWRYRIENMDLDGIGIEGVQAFCQNAFYKQCIKELEETIAEKEGFLKHFHFEDSLSRYTSMAMCLFEMSLTEKYQGKTNRKLYELDDLWKCSDDFIRDYPVVLSTTYSLRSSLSKRTIYDYVIIDEASQVDLATGALALSCARKTVIVGDLKQLPNVVDQKGKEITDAIFDSFDLREAYRYSGNSLLSSVTKLFPNVPRVLLREHYRCHPEIIGFCNKRFYNGELIVLTRPKKSCEPMLIYKTAPGNHARDHYNQRQIDVIKNEVIPQQNLNLSDGSVGIVTPYRNQANALQKEFSGTSVKADTADKFQGQERSVMIFSTVDNEIGEFASDPNRLNVAVSRAIDQFIVVTDGNDNDNASPIHDLIGYIQYNRHEIINSEIHSVFDYLYEKNAEARQAILNKYGRFSEFDSENLMLALIRSALAVDEFTQFGVVMHVPLRMVLKSLEKLESKELAFASNHLTHVDFLVFSRITHQPVLVIEVDGFAYHQNEKQKERDMMKDSILLKYGIPILRLNTVGSGEKAKVIEALQAVLH